MCRTGVRDRQFVVVNETPPYSGRWSGGPKLEVGPGADASTVGAHGREMV